MMNETSLSPMELTFRAGELMTRYAATLDGGDLEAWSALFVEAASYTVASAENVREGWPLLLINDGELGRIGDRVRYVREFWAGSFNGYTTRHVLSLPRVLSAEQDCMDFEQSFSLYMTESDMSGDGGGQTALLCVGRYLCRTDGLNDGCRIRRLQAVLDTFTLTRSLVYPV
jgi:3-phenylpropionate/cinnamic acid dioxygenase small subunit